MGEKLYGADDILKKFKGVDKALDNLWCALDKCCAKSPINIGEGLGLYKQLYNGKWEFKSIFPGSNISFTDTGEEIIINATAQPFDCQDVLDCLGISPEGSATKYLNEQGDWVTISGSGFTCSDLLFCSTTNLPEGSNLYYNNERAQDAVGNILTNSSQIAFTYNDLTPSISANFVSNNISQFTNDAGYITSATPSLTNTYVGVGSAGNLLSGSANFSFDYPNQLLNIAFASGDVINVDVNNSFLEIVETSGGGSLIFPSFGEFRITTAGNGSLSLNDNTSIYSIGAVGFGNGTNILINDTGSRNITLDADNGVIVSNLIGTGTQMVVADINGLLSKQAIPPGLISSVSDTSTIDLDVTLGVLTANFINSAGYTTNTGTVTSISGSGGSTGLTLTGGAITTSGTLTIGGTLITSNGGTGLTSYTQGDILYYDSSTTLSKLAKDTNATRYLSNQGSSNNPSWSQINLINGTTGILLATQGGTWVLLSTATASSSATIDFTGFTSAYKAYVVLFDGVTCSVNAQNLLLRVGTGSGPTYQTGNVYETQNISATAGAGLVASGSGSTSSISINTLGTGANDVCSGSLFIFNPSQSAFYHDFEGSSNTHRSSYGGSNRSKIIYSGAYQSSTPVTAIRFFMASGDIVTGNFYLYGIQ